MSYSALPLADDEEEILLEKASSIPIYRSSLNNAVHEWGSTSTSTIKHEEDVELNDMEQGGFVSGQDQPLGRLQKFPTLNFWQILILLSVPLLIVGTFIILLLLPSNPSTSKVPVGNCPDICTHPTSIHPPISQGLVEELEEIDGSFDPRPLQKLCAATVWREGLYFGHYPGTVGGAGNVRNIFTAGLRFAIEAGAAAFVIHRIIPRSTNDLSGWQFDRPARDFTYFFDREHFKATWAEACPQMRLYDDIDELKEHEWATKEALLLLPKRLDPSLKMKFYISQPQLWRAESDDFLVSLNKTFSPEEPIMIQMDDTILSWPVLYDNPGIVKTLARPFRIPAHIRQMAIAVLSQLKSRFSLDINIAKGTFSSAGYFGAHLRTEADATGGGFGSYQNQADSFLTLAHQGGNGYKVIYVASGDSNEVEKLKQQAIPYNMTVVTKPDLLSGTDLEALISLSWDQQGQVDYEVMLRAGFFAGTGASSFSYNVAAKRHVLLMKGDEEGRNWTPGELGDGAWWGVGGEFARYGPGDNLSMVLAGTNVGLFGQTIWP